MSLDATKSVWAHSKQEGSALLMLLAIAECANDYGEARPGLAYLAEKARMKVRNAQVLLRQLQESGELEVRLQAGDPTPTGRTNLYLVKLPGLPQRQGVQSSAPLQQQGVQNPVARGAKSCIQGVQSFAPKPSNETELTQNDGERVRGTPPPPDQESIRWLQSLGLYPSQVRTDIEKRPVFTPDQRELCEQWIDQQNFAKAHVALHTQFLSKGNLPTLAKPRTNGHLRANGLAPPPPDGTPEERQRRWEQYTAEMDAAEGIAPP